MPWRLRELGLTVDVASRITAKKGDPVALESIEVSVA